jgi:hypothetical protein
MYDERKEERHPQTKTGEKRSLFVSMWIKSGETIEILGATQDEACSKNGRNFFS